MWITIRELSRLIDVSPRSIQVAVKNGKIAARKKNAKTLEVDLQSIPDEWKKFLPDEYKEASLNPVILSSKAIEVSGQLGTRLSTKERLRAEIVNYFKALDPLLPIKARDQITASTFSTSVSTVRRYRQEIEEYGVLGKRKESNELKNWSAEAEEFLKGWYLSFLRKTNKDSKIAAYNAVCAEGLKRGWKVGSRSSAYTILSSIPELVKRYAVAGNRALDNHFYIKRDWSNLKPAQILIGDQHICDFWVADYSKDKPEYYRPELYVWQDAATRCIAGLAVDKTYSSDTVLEALRMAISRFGFFDCTYNDNGSSECSKAATQIIDDLILISNNRSRMKDISDLYKTDDGSYAVEDPDEDVIGYAYTAEEWRRKHRRIYANVKNAKTKPIERLFGTIEEKMAQKGIPGHVKTMGAPADQEEKEEAVLNYQKQKGMILTLDQFIVELIRGIDEYEHSKHSTLGCSPWEMVERHIHNGWISQKPASKEELDYIFLSRTKCKIKKGRVTVNRIDYIGEDLKTVADDYVDVGLHLHEGETVEVRYSKWDDSRCYAVIPSSKLKIRPLRKVEAISMLDDEAMESSIRWKRSQMKFVRDLFYKLSTPSSESQVRSDFTSQIEAAYSAELARPDPVKDLILLEEAKKPSKPGKKSFTSNFEHYKYLLGRIKRGEEIEEKEILFKLKYEASEEYENQKTYWNVYLEMEE